jgi:broad specificity phosphatase PhoE
MTTTFWLIRHGETDWNRAGRYQGQADVPLNATGLAQARETAEMLARVDGGFAAIFSSPLRRARQTAEEAAILLRQVVHEDARLMEIHQGEWTGKDVGSIVAHFGDPMAASRADGVRDSVHTRAPGGESVAEVAARMHAAAEAISAAYPNQRVLVFTHGLALATLYCQAAEISLEDVYHHIPHNGQTTIIDWDE